LSALEAANASTILNRELEVWYPEDEEVSFDEISDLMQASYETHNQTTVLMGGAIKLGGGSKSGKSDKKQLMKKLLTSELYKRLASSKNKIVLTSKPDSDKIIE
jgi:hypothetical protein